MARGRTESQTAVRAITAGAALLGFCVRVYWMLRIQSPFSAVYSDMAGYVVRADDLLAGQSAADPRTFAFYPWGTHVILAGEFAVLGRHSEVAIALAHALVGSLPVACVVLLAARATKSSFLLAVVGGVAALWQPQIASAAFFMSELWFSAAIAGGSLLFVRSLEGKRGALGAGLAFAVAFAVRPQVLLTGVLVAGLSLGALRAHLAAARGARWWRQKLARCAALLLPVALVAAGSAIRFHHLTGHVGLISENGALMRTFGATDIARIEATWMDARGIWSTAWYSPGMRHPVLADNIVRIEGYVGDPELLERVRTERLRGVGLGPQLRRMLRNAEDLLWHNFPVPEEDYSLDPRRALLQRIFRRAAVTLLPVALLGLVAIRRQRPLLAVVLGNLVSAPIVAAFFYGEARYRVPYDPFLLVAAAAGVAFGLQLLVKVVRAAVRRVRRGRAGRT